MNVYQKDYLAKNEVKEETWNTKEHPDAKKLRDAEARRLRKEGWTVETEKYDFSGFGLSSVAYTLTATRPRRVREAVNA